MVIYLNPRENYWLAPIQQGFSRGVSLGLQEAIRRKREEEKIRQATEIAQSLVDEVDDISPTNTYITDTPDYTIEEQEIDPFKETRERFGVREKLREGLLSSGAIKDALKLDTPKSSSITDVMKSPMEYMQEVYKKTAPLLAKGAAIGLDMSDIVSSRIKSYEEAYKAKEEEAKRLREIQRKVKSNYTKVGLVFKKYGKEIDPETQAQLAVAMAYGDITRDDLKMMVSGKYKAITMEDPNGNKRFMVFDQETGEVVKEKVYEFDMDLFERKERVKAKYGKGGSKSRGKWIDMMVTKEVKDMFGNVKTVEVPNIITFPNGEQYKIQLNNTDNRARAININKPWEIIELTEEQAEMFKRAQGEKAQQAQEYSTVDDKSLVGP